MTDQPTRYCEDCDNYLSHTNPALSICNRQRNGGAITMVTRAAIPSARECVTERAFVDCKDYCGPGAKFFKPKVTDAI